MPLNSIKEPFNGVCGFISWLLCNLHFAFGQTLFLIRRSPNSCHDNTCRNAISFRPLVGHLYN